MVEVLREYKGKKIIEKPKLSHSKDNLRYFMLAMAKISKYGNKTFQELLEMIDYDIDKIHYLWDISKTLAMSNEEEYLRFYKILFLNIREEG